MTTLYRPVLIESAEQAEALGFGTMAFEGGNVYVKGLDGKWRWAGTDDLVTPEATAAIGFEALVPIEAEEETVAFGDDHAIPTHNGVISNGDPIPNGWRHHTRLVTPWEDA